MCELLCLDGLAKAPDPFTKWPDDADAAGAAARGLVSPTGYLILGDRVIRSPIPTT